MTMMITLQALTVLYKFKRLFRSSARTRAKRFSKEQGILLNIFPLVFLSGNSFPMGFFFSPVERPEQ